MLFVRGQMADKHPHGKGLQHAPALSSTKEKELERRMCWKLGFLSSDSERQTLAEPQGIAMTVSHSRGMLSGKEEHTISLKG